MITLKSKFKEAVDVLVRLGACEDNLKWCNALLKAKPEMLVPEALDALCKDEKAPQNWSVWIVAKGNGEIDTEVQNGFMKKITDPMTALQVLLQADYLTAEQDAAMENIYKGKLPTVEKELRTGVITTAKSRLNQWQ